jgi:AcrR family transcriptional regulator
VKTKRVFKVQEPKTARVDGSDSLVRARIIAAAGRLFFHRGFVHVTADDMAAELGISKATLYKEFRSKEEILRAVVHGFTAEMVGGVDSLIRDETLNFVEKLARLLAFFGSRLSQLGTLFIRDIQRSAPAVWEEIEEFRRDKIIINFKTILEAGQRQGLFRGDIDLDLLLQMFLRLVEEFINPAEILRSGRSPAATFESVIKVFFQGILTDKGRLDFSARTPALFRTRKEGVS